MPRPNASFIKIGDLAPENKKDGTQRAIHLQLLGIVHTYMIQFEIIILVTFGCGSTSSENLTYFEVSNANEGECTAKICKQDGVCQVLYIQIDYYSSKKRDIGLSKNDSVFQIRLDFDTFVITGPSTTTTSSTNLKHIGGTFDSASGKKVSLRSVCATDIFNVAYATSVPSLCGTLTGDHGMYEINTYQLILMKT